MRHDGAAIDVIAALAALIECGCASNVRRCDSGAVLQLGRGEVFELGASGVTRLPAPRQT